MSYDLYLKPRSGDFSEARFLSYFEDRFPCVVEGQQAWYQNDDTGVYFAFEAYALRGEGEDDDPASGYPVSFNMNFFRPSFFALEAEPELSHVVGEFDLVVFDPQIDGMGEGEHDPSRFLSGWRAGNELGYSTVLRDADNGIDVLSLPSKKLEGCWRWNHERGKLQEELGDSIFVPRIMFFNDDGAVIPAVVWSDGIPTAFPSEINAVVVYLKDMAPSTLFRRGEETIAFESWATIRPLVKRFGRAHGDAIISVSPRPTPSRQAG